MINTFINKLREEKDTRWLVIWLAGTILAGVWDILFLNGPALKQVSASFANTMVISLLVTAMTLLLGWLATLGLHYLEARKNRAGYLLASFVLNLVRSVPQIVGVLFAYVGIAALIEGGALHSAILTFLLMAGSLSLFIFLEMADLMRERIAYYQKLDFYNALQVCGVAERRIVNFDILWKNSRVHILNKLIAVFGSAVFLQCSVDFIISVGLSTDVNSVTLPSTLGSLLAKIDSKQDILAIGYTLTHPSYFPHLFLGHLQGVTVAFLIVFTLLCIFNISNGYTERNKL
jgi:hypothetical protein